MKFSRKMRLMIILKVTRNQGFTLSLEDTFFEKSIRGVSRFRFKWFLDNRMIGDSNISHLITKKQPYKQTMCIPC